MGLAAAFIVIQIYAAMRAKAAAIAAADYFHGNRQIHLLGQDIRQEESLAFEERDVRIVEIEVELLILVHGGHWPVIEIEVAADLFHHGIQAAGANQLNAGVQVAEHTNLPVNKFCRCTDFQRFDLAELARVEVECTWGVALPDANLPDAEFVYVQKHCFSPNCRAKIHYKTRVRFVKKATTKWASVTRSG